MMTQTGKDACRIRRPKMSLVMRKPAFCIYENKDADQLCANREADQRLCFRYNPATIAQWLEPRPSDPAVVGSSPGWGGHICACHTEV